jgi:hypothetical protein
MQARKLGSGTGGNIELDRDESRWVEGASKALPGERLDDGDNSDDVSVELWQLVGGNPKFLVRAAARELNGVALRSDAVDLKLGDDARVAGRPHLVVTFTARSSLVATCYLMVS